MIQVTELRGQSRIVNADLIEFIEAAPDTQLVMRDGRRVFVLETPEEVVARVVEYKRRCNQPPAIGPRPGPGPTPSPRAVAVV